MKTLSRLVFISAFVGIAHAALIVPYWQQLEVPEEPKPKSPELDQLQNLKNPKNKMMILIQYPPIGQKRFTDFSQVLFGNLFLITRKHGW